MGGEGVEYNWNAQGCIHVRGVTFFFTEGGPLTVSHQKLWLLLELRTTLKPQPSEGFVKAEVINSCEEDPCTTIGCPCIAVESAITVARQLLQTKEVYSPCGTQLWTGIGLKRWEKCGVQMLFLNRV